MGSRVSPYVDARVRMTQQTMPPPDLLARLPTRSGPVLRILFCGDLRPHGTSRHRRDAMRRLGHSVIEIDPFERLLGASPWRTWLMLRVLAGPAVAAVQRAILDLADAHAIDVVWVDKGIFMRRETVVELSRRGAATVHYSSDLPFGTRSGDVGQRLLNAAVPAYDICVVPSPGHEAIYRANGARSVARMRFGFDPFTHFPTADGGHPLDPSVDIRFIGTPYGDRPQVLTNLERDHGLRVTVNGGRWNRVLDRRDREAVRPGPELLGPDYRRAVWDSAICLGFTTRAMRHDEARRWVEIAACGGFLLAEGPEAPGAFFRAGLDLVHYRDTADLAATARRYLQDPDGRARIAASAQERVWPARSNDVLLDDLLTGIAGGVTGPSGDAPRHSHRRGEWT